jgi:hypothetical protein
MHDQHLLSPKRLNLLISPLTCLTAEEVHSEVKLSAMQTWATLLYAMGPINIDKFASQVFWTKLPHALKNEGPVADYAVEMLRTFLLKID